MVAAISDSDDGAPGERSDRKSFKSCQRWCSWWKRSDTNSKEPIKTTADMNEFEPMVPHSADPSALLLLKLTSDASVQQMRSKLKSLREPNYVDFVDLL